MSLECERVARHIRRGEQSARRKDVAHLSRVQKLIRALLLDELAMYIEKGRFPKNRSAAALAPTFVDEDGTRCAVAHMMELGGAAALVSAVANKANHAYVADLASDASFLAWLGAAGFTVEEAALIQPAYCSEPHSSCLCGDVGYGGSADGVLEGTIVASSSGRSTMRIDEIYGNNGGHYSGEQISVAMTPIGTHLLAPLYAGSSDLGALIVLKNDRPEACPEPLPLSKQQAIDALRASDCNAALAKVDPRWADSVCKKENGGCAVSGSDPSSVAILCAIVGAIAARRVRRR